MKRWNRKIVRCTFVIILFSLFSCKNSSRKEESAVRDHLSGFLSEVGMTDPPSRLIIVPTQGCGPCIKAAMDFLRDTVKSAGITAVISGPSRKSCLLLMKKFNVERQGVVIDSKSQAKDYGVLTIYPTILSNERGTWLSTNITPENYDKAFASFQ